MVIRQDVQGSKSVLFDFAKMRNAGITQTEMNATREPQSSSRTEWPGSVACLRALSEFHRRVRDVLGYLLTPEHCFLLWMKWQVTRKQWFHSTKTRRSQAISTRFLWPISRNIRMLRYRFSDAPAPSLLSNPPCHSFSHFESIIHNEAIKSISTITSKSSSLDPIPSHFVIKLNLPELVSDFVNIVNTSFAAGSVPQRHKRAIVRPLLRNLDLIPTFWQIVDPFLTYYSNTNF